MLGALLDQPLTCYAQTLGTPAGGLGHLLLQHSPLPPHGAPAGNLHSPAQQTLPPVQVTQVPPPEPQSRFVLPA